MRIEKNKYLDFLAQIKTRIQTSRVRVVLSVNAELIYLYWDIGRMIDTRQKKEGWGAGVIPKLSKDISNELSEVKGFSERNIGYMIRFAREYEKPVILQQPVAKLSGVRGAEKLPQAVAKLQKQKGDKNMPQAAAKSVPKEVSEKLQQTVAKIPWGHNVLLMEKVKDMSSRLWYMQKTIKNGWSRNVLSLMIKSRACRREGRVAANFDLCLPPRNQI